MNSQTIIFFDGVCHLCNGFVDFLIRQDRKHRLNFAPLQGSTAKDVLGDRAAAPPESVLLWDEGKLFERSDAVLRVFSKLGGIYTGARLLRIFPSTFLDFFYRIIAKNRYRWFGEREFCRFPTTAEKEFLLP